MDENLEWRPDIATRWEMDDGALGITYHLRPWVWSDGAPLTARDFVVSLDLFKDPRVASPNRGCLRRRGGGRGARRLDPPLHLRPAAARPAGAHLPPRVAGPPGGGPGPRDGGQLEHQHGAPVLGAVRPGGVGAGAAALAGPQRALPGPGRPAGPGRVPDHAGTADRHPGPGGGGGGSGGRRAAGRRPAPRRRGQGAHRAHRGAPALLPAVEPARTPVRGRPDPPGPVPGHRPPARLVDTLVYGYGTARPRARWRRFAGTTTTTWRPTPTTRRGPARFWPRTAGATGTATASSSGTAGRCTSRS